MTIINEYPDRVNVSVERANDLPLLYSRTRSSRPAWSLVNPDGSLDRVLDISRVNSLEARYQRALCPEATK